MSHLVLGLSSDTEANACNERQTSCAWLALCWGGFLSTGDRIAESGMVMGVTIWGIKPQPAIISPELALAPDVPLPSTPLCT